MNRKEYDAWLTHTEASKEKWQMDEIAYHNHGDCLFYKGGTTGSFIWITKTGYVMIGDYEDAIPHIGEAAFSTRWHKQFAGREEALAYVLERAGIPFLKELFSTI